MGVEEGIMEAMEAVEVGTRMEAEEDTMEVEEDTMGAAEEDTGVVEEDTMGAVEEDTTETTKDTMGAVEEDTTGTAEETMGAVEEGDTMGVAEEDTGVVVEEDTMGAVEEEAEPDPEDTSIPTENILNGWITWQDKFTKRTRNELKIFTNVTPPQTLVGGQATTGGRRMYLARGERAGIRTVVNTIGNR
ncbi:hypothetical protein MMC10_008008 [Thelotrema lepadinum]|nr:hypothetical protein [Thelotrema lepadinum]